MTLYGRIRKERGREKMREMGGERGKVENIYPLQIKQQTKRN